MKSRGLSLPLRERFYVCMYSQIKFRPRFSLVVPDPLITDLATGQREAIAAVKRHFCWYKDTRDITDVVCK